MQSKCVALEAIKINVTLLLLIINYFCVFVSRQKSRRDLKETYQYSDQPSWLLSQLSWIE